MNTQRVSCTSIIFKSSERISMARRRQFLMGVATASTVTIAGCSSSSDPTTGEETEATGPETVVKQMGTALAEGNVEAANELVHPDSPRKEFTEEVAASVVEQNEVQEVSPSKEDYIQKVAESAKNLDEGGVRSFDNDVQQAVSENDFDEYSIVLSSSEFKNESFDGEPVWVIKDGGEWYVWT